MMLTSCSGRSHHSPSDSAETVTDLHADYDIAMTVRSITDALNVGERLDSASYNFRGILTDGSGRPIYTDTIGNPGAWTIKVVGADSAVITSLYPGDLLPLELTSYIVESVHALPSPDSTLYQAHDARISFHSDSLSRMSIEISRSRTAPL
ncbi:MAG: hypothetical protein NC328_06790 [Muribaculum sp.]|nr:hypothetical protein [Muribaculum sp.]